MSPLSLILKWSKEWNCKTEWKSRFCKRVYWDPTDSASPAVLCVCPMVMRALHAKAFPRHVFCTAVRCDITMKLFLALNNNGVTTVIQGFSLNDSILKLTMEKRGIKNDNKLLGLNCNLLLVVSMWRFHVNAQGSSWRKILEFVTRNEKEMLLVFADHVMMIHPTVKIVYSHTQRDE